MGISRQAYYQRLACTRERAQACSEVIQRVDEIRLRQPRIGTRKLQHLLQQPNGIYVGRDALFSLLRNARRLVPTKRAYHKTTNSHHRFRLKIIPTRNQFWTSYPTLNLTLRGGVNVQTNGR
jgi:putative transposase